jgi:hypothetical protein
VEYAVDPPVLTNFNEALRPEARTRKAAGASIEDLKIWERV